MSTYKQELENTGTTVPNSQYEGMTFTYETLISDPFYTDNLYRSVDMNDWFMLALDADNNFYLINVQTDEVELEAREINQAKLILALQYVTCNKGN